MPSPSLSDLPPPPSGKSGWPWVEETPQLTDRMAEGSPWPRVSVITPSYNQGPFIEETIRSVLLQGYPDLEYIVMDGGSTDESVEIIKKYEPWLAYWTSEPDRGQSHAINKGLKRAEGEVVAYLNSDDIYLSGTMQQALLYMMDHEDVDIVYGDCLVTDAEGRTTGVWRSRPFDLFGELCLNSINQPTVFMKRRVLDLVGYFDEELRYTMDIDYWFRAAMLVKFSYLPIELAAFRIAEDSKTGISLIPFAMERRGVLDRFFRSYAESDVAKWRNRVFSWDHYRAGSQLYSDNERGMARGEFIKGIRLEPFSLKTLAALLAIFDTHLKTNVFGRLAAGLPINLKPSKGHKT
jgi:glycosyltransferase involved in cell wall biosynthesis